MKYQISRTIMAACVMALACAGAVSAAEPQTSPQMEKAKDFIAEEQWNRAIEALKAAAADAKEKHRDEALFWLAHSQHQAHDLGGAVETISELERKFPTSRWVKPARSLRVELAQKLRRHDVLWWTATDAPAPPAPAPRAATPSARPPAPPSPSPTPVGRPPRVMTPRPPQPAEAPPSPSPPPTLPRVWVSEYSAADTDLRIQALGSLMRTDAPRVIPILRNIALESSNPREASRAVFVLAQSGRPEAHVAVLELARNAPEAVSVAAVRELGRFGGAKVPEELLHVYASGKPRVKYQVVEALGERSATGALLEIVRSEPDLRLRDRAIVTLGQAGGRQHLQRLYRRARAELKRPIIVGLFNARAEEELIEIARSETDAAIRAEIHRRLRLLGTPKARAYLETVKPGR